MKRSFTLLEALCVMGILATLVSILLPATARARSRAHSTTCASHLRQIGVSLRLYLEDHEGRYPDLSTWNVRNISGLSQALGCPSTLKRRPLEPVSTIAPGLSGYALNAYLTFLPEIPDSRPQQDPEILYPTRTILVAEAPDGVTSMGQVDPFLFNESGRSLSPEDAWKRHQSGAQYLFCDGHIRWLRREQIWERGLSPGLSPSPEMPRFILESP